MKTIRYKNLEGFIISSVPNIFKSSKFNIIIIYIILYMKLKGGSLKVNEIKAFLEARYMENIDYYRLMLIV